MKIRVIGGGPGGLYFALLARKTLPGCDVVVHERNKSDDTFGWGVVFSDETLGGFEEADPESFEAIRSNFAYWTDIETFIGPVGQEACVRSTGHGFCGLSRKQLLQLLHDRCTELGVELHFESEVSATDFPDADLIVAADGINSVVRARYEECFQPSVDWRRCRFTWLGTNKPLEAFTFIFRENQHGLFQVHAYPFRVGDDPLSTWIVECHQDTYERAGFAEDDEEATVAYMQELFADHLEGYELLTNRSLWRTFPTVKCERWHKDNIVLLGDAVHTAHFSIGSGTKLAMEDAIALRDAFLREGTSDVPRALAAYEDARRIDTIKTQRAAQTSLEWFENSSRYTGQSALQFKFNLMTRSKRITYDNLALRDPELVEQVTRQWWEDEGLAPPEPRKSPAAPDQLRTPPPMFAPLKVRGATLPNRIVVSPMCQYSATDGTIDDWHLVHLGSRAIGGAGLLMCEMTNISAQGRITYGCAGLWSDEHAAAWRRVVDFAHANAGGLIGIQLGHAGRKGSCHLPWEGDSPLRDDSAWETLGPSADPFGPGWHTPREMDRADMDRVTAEYVSSTRLALAADFDVLEVHMAHGYLLSSFLSPLSNRRTDAYGGSLEDRLRYPLEVLDAVRAEWPDDRPLFVRISATDWLDDEGGLNADEAVEISRALGAHGCDVIDVSSAGNSPESVPDYGRMYQVPFADRIRHETGMRVMAVGAILGADHANTVLAAGRADLAALARPHLVSPHLTLRAAVDYGVDEQAWPRQYLAAKPKRRE